MTVDLEFENSLVLAVLQSLIGAIGPEVVAVSIEFSSEENMLSLFFLVSEVSEKLREVVDEVEGDLDALLSGAVLVTSHCSVGLDRGQPNWMGQGKRQIFARSA
jgi:hypothetical protein